MTVIMSLAMSSPGESRSRSGRDPPETPDTALLTIHRKTDFSNSSNILSDNLAMQVMEELERGGRASNNCKDSTGSEEIMLNSRGHDNLCGRSLTRCMVSESH